MTGQLLSPRRLASSISSTSSVNWAVTTDQTSSTVRPDASMRARIAALISRVAASRSAGVLSQCGSGGACGVDEVVVGIALFSRKDSLLDTQDSGCGGFRQESFLECVRGTDQADARAPAL